jgi:hypothetical protein
MPRPSAMPCAPTGELRRVCIESSKSPSVRTRAASARAMPTRIKRSCVARPQSAASGTYRHDGIKAKRLRAGWGHPYLLRGIGPKNAIALVSLLVSVFDGLGI